MRTEETMLTIEMTTAKAAVVNIRKAQTSK